MRDNHRILFRPMMTEKSTAAKDACNQVTFEVSPDANKIEIRKAVEDAFDLKGKVLKVRTVNMLGKKRRVGRHTGYRPDWKKAVVTLAPGAAIQFFDGV